MEHAKANRSSRRGPRRKKPIRYRGHKRSSQASKGKKKGGKVTDRIEVWVEQIIAPDVLAVSPGWAMGTKHGREVHIKGISAHSVAERGHELKEKLAELVLGSSIEIAPPFSVDADGRLVCDVYASGKKLTTTLLDNRAHA